MTTSPKVVLTDALLPSVAVTRMVRLPTSPFPGVPEKVFVAGSKLSQAGSAEPSARVALRVSVSPISGSVKVPAGTVKLKLPFCAMVCSATGVDTTGGRLLLFTVSPKVVLTEALLPSVAVIRIVRLPTSL